MQINKFRETIVSSWSDLYNLSLFRILDLVALHEASELNDPIAEQTGDHMQDTETCGDNHADLGVLINAQVECPHTKPDNVGQKERPDVQVEEKGPK